MSNGVKNLFFSLLAWKYKLLLGLVSAIDAGISQNDYKIQFSLNVHCYWFDKVKLK